jgi:hypothetical protein
MLPPKCELQRAGGPYPARAALATRALCAILLLSESASAEPVSLKTRYSVYEEQAIRDAAAILKSGVDTAPNGKQIERIDFVRIDPIDPHDPAPLALNRVHVTSRPGVLRHELLVREGSTWSDVLVDESARNLRLLPQVSLVLCVPMRGSTPDTVRLVVITKDVWSLYVDFGISGVNLLDLEPKETNFLGLHQTILGRFVLTPDTYSLGASYQVPRFAGRFVSFSVDANVIVNKWTGSPEGHYGSVNIGRPLYTSMTKWAWATNLKWDDEISRGYSNGLLECWTPANFDAASSCPSSIFYPPVPWVYRKRTILEEAELVRSFGWQTKSDFAVGASIGDASYVVPPSPPLVNPDWVTQFKNTKVPRGDDRVGPFVQWHGYTSNFLRIIDFDTLALQEDYRLGHEVYLRVYPVLGPLGSTRNVIGTYASAAYGVRLGDGVARALVESTVEYDADGRGTPDGKPGISDASLNTELGVASPRILGLGRLVLNVTVLDRPRNYLNALSYLGSDSLLRGYPTQAFNGADLVASNLEFRSRPVDVASLQFGAAAFYDAGDAFDSFENIRPKQSAGVGLRILLPQVTRSVFRLDFAIPLAGPHIPGIPNVFFTFGQAIGLPVPTPPGIGLPD